MTILRALVFAFFPLLVAANGARADRVTLVDGSQLVGKVERLLEGKLIITTDFAGKLEIDAAKVLNIECDGVVNVDLATGDRLVGKIAPTADGAQSTVASSVASATVTTDQITAVWPEGAPSPDDIKAEKARPKWSSGIEGGIIATEGNSDTLNGNLRGDITRTSPVDLLKFYAQSDYGEQNDERNKNQHIIGSIYEHSLPNPWERWGGPYLWYVRSEFEYDEFENLDLRATLAGGLGHYWIKKDNHALTTRVGAGYRHQTFMDDTTTDDPILDAGFDYRRDIREWATFMHSTLYNPSLEDFGEYRLVFDTGLLFPISKDQTWKLKLGMRNEYNSDPQPGFDELDNTYYANIRVDFK